MNNRSASLDLGDNNQTPLLIGDSMSEKDLKSPLRVVNQKTEGSPTRSQKSRASVKKLNMDKLKSSNKIDEDEEGEMSCPEPSARKPVSPDKSKPVVATAPAPDDDGIVIPEADDIPNNTDKCIDFETQLVAYKKRTTSVLPYTLT